MAEAWLFKVEDFPIMRMRLSNSGFFQLGTQNLGLNTIYCIFQIWFCSPSYLTLSCHDFCSYVHTEVIFLPSFPWCTELAPFPFLSACPDLSWPLPAYHENQRGHLYQEQKNKIQKRRTLGAGWNQVRLGPGTKPKSMFKSSFGSRRCATNIPSDHYKHLHLISCYTVLSTINIFQFLWHLQSMLPRG